MKIPHGTKVGWLVDDHGNTALDVCVGKIMQLGPVKGYVLWNEGKGFEILFTLPSIIPGLVVTKDAVPQAGAFLLKSQQSFYLSNHGKENTYQFKVIRELDIPTEKDDRCEFCRSALSGNRAIYCLTAVFGNEQAASRALLCNACSAAWDSR